MGRPTVQTPKSLPVSVRLPPEVKAAAEKAAREDTRSLSSFFEKLLTDHLRAKGYLPAASAEPTSNPPQPADPADRYADADPDEAVMVTGVGPMILRRAVRKLDDWRDHHGLGLVSVYRGADKHPGMFDVADLGRLAEMERFR